MEHHMSNSIATRTSSHNPVMHPDDVKVLLDAARADLAALRASFLLLTAKLDLDATVTDTNYASLTNPPALTLLP
jgi:hypothetical protein